MSKALIAKAVLKKQFLSAVPEVKIRSRPGVRKLTTRPVWTIKDGITFSLLSRWIICRHRFWIRTVLGLRQDEGFIHRVEYGNMVHAGIEEFLKCDGDEFSVRVAKAQDAVARYCDTLRKEHSDDYEQIDWWQSISQFQIDRYLRYWYKTDKGRRTVYQEQVFDFILTLPSGRSIRIRGKYDGVFREGRQQQAILLETKSKGEIDIVGLQTSLQCDLQSMLYLVALDQEGIRCRKILYNCILRPCGGKYPIRQKKSETKLQFLDRIKKMIVLSPEKYFIRFPVDVTDTDLLEFKVNVLFPQLEQLLDWWESIKSDPLNPQPIGKFNPHHFKRPFGVFDSLALGNRGDYFEFITSNHSNLKGLKQVSTAFPELEEPSLADKGQAAKTSAKGCQGNATKANRLPRNADRKLSKVNAVPDRRRTPGDAVPRRQKPNVVRAHSKPQTRTR